MRLLLMMLLLVLDGFANQAFEAVSVKSGRCNDPQAPGSWTGGPGSMTPGQFMAVNVPMAVLLTYALGDAAGPELPGNMQTACYDVSIKFGSLLSRQEFRGKLLELLEQTFSLSISRTREVREVYLLKMAGKNRMKKSEADPAALPIRHFITGPDGLPAFDPLSGPLTLSIERPDGMVLVTNSMPMFRLCRILTGLLNVPVLDGTGLDESAWAFTLKFGPVRQQPGPEAKDPQEDIFSALKAQLGLALTRVRIPVDVIKVERWSVIPQQQ